MAQLLLGKRPFRCDSLKGVARLYEGRGVIRSSFDICMFVILCKFTRWSWYKENDRR